MDVQTGTMHIIPGICYLQLQLSTKFMAPMLTAGMKCAQQMDVICALLQIRLRLQDGVLCQDLKPLIQIGRSTKGRNFPIVMDILNPIALHQTGNTVSMKDHDSTAALRNEWSARVKQGELGISVHHLWLLWLRLRAEWAQNAWLMYSPFQVNVPGAQSRQSNQWMDEKHYIPIRARAVSWDPSVLNTCTNLVQLNYFGSCVAILGVMRTSI